MTEKSKSDGFSEAPQAPFEGKPLSNSMPGDLSSWAQEIADEADAGPQGLRDDVAREAEAKALTGKPPVKRKPKKSETVGDKRTGGGTIIGGSNDVKERVAAGLNPVAGLDVSAEEAMAMASTSGVTATVQALSDLIEHGRDEMKGDIWVPHRPARPEKSEGGIPFEVVSEYEPKGDQPTAIRELVGGLKSESGSNEGGERTQVLLGVTGSGKTFTMAKIIEETNRPALILAPNKTLAAQLYGEMKSFFPNNAVEYFVSYYDYYQPEAYVPRSDTFIEKESSVNEQIDRMRHSATRSLLERDDVIIVASVSCIYGIGSVETYTAMTFQMKIGDTLNQRQLLADLVAQQYKRRDMDFQRGSFRVRGTRSRSSRPTWTTGPGA